MRRITALALLCAALAVLGAATAGSASAAKLTLTNHGVALPPGYTFEIYGVLNEDFSFNTSGGAIGSCEGGEIADPIFLEVVTNSQWTDELRILASEGAVGSRCQGFVDGREENVFPTLSQHGVIKIRAGGVATVPTGLAIGFERLGNNENGQTCSYQVKQSGLNNATASPQPLVLSFDRELRVARNPPGEPEPCPARATVNMSLPHTFNFEGEEDQIDEQLTSLR
jgi:hypothetical protein